MNAEAKFAPTRHPRPATPNAFTRAATTLAALGGACVLFACQTSPIEERNAWNTDSTGPRFVYHALGYPGTQTGRYENYRDFQWQEKQAINLTLRRHVLNRNPENPFQPYDEDYGRERPPHSLADPVTYLHVSALATGFIVLAATGGAAFVPIPIDSLFGTLERGGGEEFVDGFRADDDRVSRHTRRVPPRPNEFEVKHPNAPRRIFQ